MVMINKIAIDVLSKRIGIKTRAELARRLKITPSQLSQTLHGRKAATLTTIGKICAVLDCQPGAFLEYRPDEA